MDAASVTFFGLRLTTLGGVQIYKGIISFLPLIPIIVLLVQNGIYVNDLLANQNSIISTEGQVRTTPNDVLCLFFTAFLGFVKFLYSLHTIETKYVLNKFLFILHWMLKVNNVANLASFISKLQNERLALIFANSPSLRKLKSIEGKG